MSTLLEWAPHFGIHFLSERPLWHPLFKWAPNFGIHFLSERPGHSFKVIRYCMQSHVFKIYHYLNNIIEISKLMLL